MQIILSHPTGNANVRAAAKSFADKGIMLRFYTTIAVFAGDFLDFLTRFRPFFDLKRRRYDNQLQPLTESSPFYETGRMVSSKLRIDTLTKKEIGIFSIDSVYQNLDRRVAAAMKQPVTIKPNAVYAYEDGAYFSFVEAKKQGIACFYDLPIGYWRAARRLLTIERQIWPEWESTLGIFSDSDLKLNRKDEELKLADRIFVASSFTKNTLLDFPGHLAPIEVIPYGFPPVCEERNYSSTVGRPLKMLFVGGLSQRKGIANLFAAVDKFGSRIELTIVGLKPAIHCDALQLGLSKHRWIPGLPNADILRLMREHDVLVFPSLFEGFGLVITEAMSQGTPVITTERTVGPEFIHHGHNGWIVEAGSTTSLVETIDKILTEAQLVSQVGKAAKETASQRPWSHYMDELALSVQKNIHTSQV